LGLVKMPRLDLVFAEVTEKNVEQLRLMNELIFPVRYNDQFYKDAYKNLKLAQFGASARVGSPAPGSPLLLSVPTASACGAVP
jgi:hypothetical protein